MAGLADDMKLQEIVAIPGTHNSGAIDSGALLWSWAKCQSASLLEQLCMGVRRLDFRLSDEGTNDEILIAHKWPTYLSFNQALDVLKVFLEEHPSEIVFLCIKRDWDNRKSWHSSSSALATLNSKGFRFPNDLGFEGSRTTVGAVRGCLFVSSQDHCMWQTAASDYTALLPGRCNLDRGFLDVWEAGSPAAAKAAICRRLDAQPQPTKHSQEQEQGGVEQEQARNKQQSSNSSARGENMAEPVLIPGFSTNVVLAGGVVQPWYVAWCMNGWVRRRCKSHWRSKQLLLGFVRFVDEHNGDD